jgi:hypothetical protein
MAGVFKAQTQVVWGRHGKVWAEQFAPHISSVHQRGRGLSFRHCVHCLLKLFDEAEKVVDRPTGGQVLEGEDRVWDDRGARKRSQLAVKCSKCRGNTSCIFIKVWHGTRYQYLENDDLEAISGLTRTVATAVWSEEKEEWYLVQHFPAVEYWDGKNYSQKPGDEFINHYGCSEET